MVTHWSESMSRHLKIARDNRADQPSNNNSAFDPLIGASPSEARRIAEVSKAALDNFDFTHIDDDTHGIVALVESLTADRAQPPPIHFVCSRLATLGELANLAVRLAAPRHFDVASYCGDPSRARSLRGWQQRGRLEYGLERLIHAFSNVPKAVGAQEVV
jgi:nucleoside-diphosphate-sugar epimerase